MHQQHTYDKNNPPPSVNAIVCFSGRGLAFIHVYTEELNSKLLIQILKKQLIKGVDKLYAKGEHWALLWDNDSTHKSSETENWLQSGCTQIIRIPSHSPDLNIAENLFADLTPRVEKHNAKNEKELKEAILEEWTKTDSQLLKRMSDSMVTRCKEVIASSGHKINH
jgi:hypothetical protein